MTHDLVLPLLKEVLSYTLKGIPKGSLPRPLPDPVPWNYFFEDLLPSTQSLCLFVVLYRPVPPDSETNVKESL